MSVWRAQRPGGDDVIGLGTGHNVRPLEIRIPDCGRRHAVVDLPSYEQGLADGAAAYLADRDAIRANNYQLARKLEDMRAALAAMGISITQEK